MDLLQSLDNLLERYLHLLDQHQKLQAELGSKLSSVCHHNPATKRFNLAVDNTEINARDISLSPKPTILVHLVGIMARTTMTNA